MSDSRTTPGSSNNANKKKLIIGSLAALGTVAIIGVSGASAAASNPKQNLIDAIASRFNLNKSDVQQVFDEQHDKMQAEHQQTMKDRLQSAVDQGKITADQRDKIIAKLDELKKTRDSLKDKTPEDRRTAMKTQFDQLKKWASDNNILVQYLMGFGGPGRIGHSDGRFGHHGMGRMGDHDGMMKPDGDADDSNNSNNTQSSPSTSPNANGTNSTSGTDSGQLL